MNSHLRGRAKALLAFTLIAVLVVGGLGWVTIEALAIETARAEADFEKEQSEQRAAQQKEEAALVADFEKELSGRLGLALWRLDSRVAPALAREDSRPYDHYGAFFAPAQLYRNDGTAIPSGEVVEQSPLVKAQLPDWMLLHFQTDAEQGWASPQVLSDKLQHILKSQKEKPAPDIAAEQHQLLLIDLACCKDPNSLLDQVKQRCAPIQKAETTVAPVTTGPNVSLPIVAPSFDQPLNSTRNTNTLGLNKNAYDYQNDVTARYQAADRLLKESQSKLVQTADLDVALANVKDNGEAWFHRPLARPAPSKKTEVKLSPMVPLWLTPQEQEVRLVIARLVKIGDKQICQGIVLDWSRLQTLLADEVRDLFPEARFIPMRAAAPARPERTMKWLPVELDPGPLEQPVAAGVALRSPPELPDWTPLRVGLALAWLAALVALLAVGLGGASLLALSERRIRFVSAVTHELRTPLTTLRLYLDMLTGGMVQGEEQRNEYLRTLNDETDRLNRLVVNVLDFSRLERQRPRLDLSAAAPADLLEQLRTDWQDRCRNAGKELVVENEAPDAAPVTTDVKLVQQVVGNLIDNACKYSRAAEDRRIWLRARRDGNRLVLEVEDRGPGVALRERRSIFRAFRRGRDADVTAGGVGLGLALARQWARLLGGRLALGTAKEGSGACFRLELPGG